LDARDIFYRELLGIVVEIGAACKSESAGFGERVVAVEHDAVEVESTAVGEDRVRTVVVAEGDGELAGPAGAAIGGWGTAVVGIGKGSGDSEGVVY
jgi:hypothetical protein